MTHPRELTQFMFVLALASACSTDATLNRGTLDVERITRGDTVIVRTLSGSVWGRPAQLVEEIRIGAVEGTDEQILGRVSEAAPDGSGGVYLFDSQVPALRHYNANGQYTRTLGGQGEGPGEYQDVALGLWVRRDGHLLMRDPRNARINVYAPDGTPVNHWPVASGLFIGNAMVVDTTSHIYLKILVERPQRNRPWRIGLLHLNAAGKMVDTIPDPQMEGEPESAGATFAVQKLWEWSPHGYMVVGVNGTYSFELRKPEGLVRVEMPHTPVPVNPEERSEYEAANDYMRRTQGRFMTAEIPPVPDTKPAYKAMNIGLDGRIWIQLHVSAIKIELSPRPPAPPGEDAPPPPLTWREPAVFDVFETDGSYLGQLRLPERTVLLATRGTEIWATQHDELDVQYVVRYRLVTGAATRQ